MPQPVPLHLIADIVSVSTPIAAVILFVWQLLKSLFRDREDNETPWSWLRDVVTVTVPRVGVFVVILGVLLFLYFSALGIVSVWGRSGFGMYVVLILIGTCFGVRVSELVADLRNGAAQDGA